MAGESCKFQNPLVLKILKNHNQLINSGKSITFCWIPSHVGIRENEDADIAAKAQRYFGVDTLKDVFENVASRNIIVFVKDINFQNRFTMLFLHQLNSLYLNKYLIFAFNTYINCF